MLKTKILLDIVLFSILLAKPAPIRLGWYYNVHPPPGYGAIFHVGPYATRAKCQDMFGSGIYSHPWKCHLTGKPIDCGITGNGFLYWADYPYPSDLALTPANDQNCVQLPIQGVDKHPVGLYFVAYVPQIGSGPAQSGIYPLKQWKFWQDLATKNPAIHIGNYADMKCPGAPGWTLFRSTACN